VDIVVPRRYQQRSVPESTGELDEKVRGSGRLTLRVRRTYYSQLAGGSRRCIRLCGQTIDRDWQPCETPGDSEPGVVGVEYHDGSTGLGHGKGYGVHGSQ
jgi:hypothetical protein